MMNEIGSYVRIQAINQNLFPDRPSPKPRRSLKQLRKHGVGKASTFDFGLVGFDSKSEGSTGSQHLSTGISSQSWWLSCCSEDTLPDRDGGSHPVYSNFEADREDTAQSPERSPSGRPRRLRRLGAGSRFS